MAIGVNRRGLRPRLPILVTALAVVASLTGCSLLGGSSSGDAESGGKGDLEKTTIRVSLMKVSDTVPFHIAREKGFFEDEGLNVKFVEAPSGGESVNKLVAGESDISFSSYLPFFLVESKGVLKNKGGMRIISDASSVSPNSSVITATPSSSVKGIKDLAGKKVAITATGTMSQLLVQSTMKANNVSDDDVKWVATPFPAMSQALKSGNVDAAYMVEPFIQDAMKKAGARPIADCGKGPTADMPLTGYAANGNFAKENPKTVAAFQRAMLRGTNEAVSDRALVDKALVKYSGVDAGTAKLAILPNFESKLDATRIQRVADLMVEFDVLDKKLDSAKLIVPTAPLD